MLPDSKEEKEKKYGYAKTLTWFFLFLILMIIILLLAWWIILLFSPSSKNDIDAKNLCLSNNAFVANRLSVGCKIKTKKVIVKDRLQYEPFETDLKEITLDGENSYIRLISSFAATPVTVTLPPAENCDGMVLYIVNNSANTSFIVQPQSNNTLNHASASVPFTTPVFAIQLIASSYLKDWSVVL